MNILERYGIREGDKPGLHKLIPVIGRREVSETIKESIPPHSMPFYQLIYVDKGELEWWVEGQFHHLSEGDLILVKPYETQSSFQGRINVGSRYFMQINLYEKSEEINSDEHQKVSRLFSKFIPRTISPGNKFKIPFLRLLKTHREPNELSSLIVKAQFLEIIRCLYEEQENYLKSNKVNISSALEMIQRVDEYLNSHLDEVISTSDLAKIFNLSDVHFRRKFLAASGSSPIKYANNRKLKEARRLLTETQMSMTDIAHALAFSSSQHFSVSFAKSYSISPREYRKEVLNAHRKAPLKKVSDVSAEIASRFTRI